MKIQNQNLKELALFFIIAYVFSWALWSPAVALANGAVLPAPLAEFAYSPYNPAAFGPSLAAFLLTLLRQGGRGAIELLKRGLDFSFKKIWLAWIFLLALFIFGGGILLTIWMGVTPADFSVLSNPALALIALPVILFTSGPLQEEFGWRGYALPRLKANYNDLVSSLILGFLWWLWHLPLVFIPGKFMADNLPLFVALLVEISLTSILFTWIYNQTHGSVLAMLLLHTAMNWSIWLFLPSMKTNLWIIGGTSLLLAGAIFLLRQKINLLQTAPRAS